MGSGSGQLGGLKEGRGPAQARTQARELLLFRIDSTAGTGTAVLVQYIEYISTAVLFIFVMYSVFCILYTVHA